MDTRESIRAAYECNDGGYVESRLERKKRKLQSLNSDNQRNTEGVFQELWIR